MTQRLLPVATLWVAGRLSPVEELCLLSFAKAGHSVTLYTYDGVDNAPPGIELRDGREILAYETVLQNRYRNGSFALASNLFRYELQRRRAGLWVDTDVVCVRPVALDLPVIVGRESANYVNGAVLYLDADLAIVQDAINAFGGGRVPEWVDWRRGLRSRAAQLLGRRIGAADLPHGTFGPKGLTALLRRHELEHYAQPADVFYPLSPKKAAAAFNGTLAWDDVVTADTLTVHLWNEKIGPWKRRPWPEKSLVADLARRCT